VGGSPRGREPMASSNSRRLSFLTGSRIPCRRRASTGIGITGCLRRITNSGPPSRRMTKGNIGKRREAVTGGHAAGGRATGGCYDGNPNQKPRSHDTSRIAWAKLMARVGEEFPLECPNCGGDIRLIAFRLFYKGETISGLRTVGDLRLLRTSCPRSRADPENPDASWRTARAAPPEAHESLISRKTVAEVPLTGLSFTPRVSLGESKQAGRSGFRAAGIRRRRAS
jgi:hypothetical protein